MDSLSFRFYLNDRTKIGDRSKIYGRLIINRKKSEFYSGFAIEPKGWDKYIRGPKNNRY